jgi:hypothetical protein
MRFWQSSSLHIRTQLHYVLIEYSPSVWLANVQKTVIKELTFDLTLSKLTCTACGNNLFHWTLINWLSPTSINEKISYVYILKAKNSTPNLTSHRHPSQAHCQGFTCTPRLDLNTGPCCGPRDPEGTSEWLSPCTQPLPTYCQKHAKKVGRTSSCVRIMQHYFEGT